MNYLKVHNWDKWQTYRKDRGQPPWIKAHRCLLRKPKWVQLTDTQRGHLLVIWLLAADRDGEIPNSPKMIKTLCCLEHEPDLNAFVAIGILDGDAKATPGRRQEDALEAETEAETEAEKKTNDAPRRRKRSEYCSKFELAWKAYERKGAKGAAASAYRRAIRDIKARGVTNPHEWLLDRVRLYREISAGSDPRYHKDFQGWLSQAEFDFDEDALRTRYQSNDWKRRRAAREFVDDGQSTLPTSRFGDE